MRIFIYALCEPDTGEIRYVGQSVDPRARLTAHLSGTAASNVRLWVATLRERGAEPMLATLDDAESAAAADALEDSFIKQLRRPRLLNSDRPILVAPRVAKPSPPSGFGERVRALRLRRGLTQEQLADKSDGLLTRLDVNKIEAGLNQGRSHRVRDGLAKAFEVEFTMMNSWLTGGLAASFLLEETP